MLNVFGGSGFLAKATNHLGSRGDVFDTKFGPWYDVTQPFVLTRIRQDVSAEKCVAGMISLPRQHTSCSSKVISASAAIANLFHRARMPWILEHPSDLTLAAQPRMAWAPAFFAYLDHYAEGERCFRLETWTADICTMLLANVLEQVDVAEFQDKNMFIQRLPHHAQSFALHVTTRPPRLSFAFAMILTMNARRFQRTHPLSGMGSSLNASKGVRMGVTGLAPICTSEPVLDAGCTAVIGSARTRALDAGSAREGRSSDVCFVGDTR